MKKGKPIDYILRNIPEQLWVRVKIAAAPKRQSLRAFILEALEEKLQKGG